MQFSKLLMVVVGLAVTGSSADCIRKPKADACGLERPINCGAIPGTDVHKCCVSDGAAPTPAPTPLHWKTESIPG
ncbi:hypothetical protein PG996_003059 [Apiospora saccharicola]|uniref:Uncharacterized protein n=1 Tax=Apiospora saccharicola TaxID=335842 RepID=A0ABR1W062_9PEZI